MDPFSLKLMFAEGVQFAPTKSGLIKGGEENGECV